MTPRDASRRSTLPTRARVAAPVAAARARTSDPAAALAARSPDAAPGRVSRRRPGRPDPASSTRCSRSCDRSRPRRASRRSASRPPQARRCGSRWAATCSSPSRRRRAGVGELDRPGRRGRHPAAGVRLGGRHGPADRDGAVRPRPRRSARCRWSPTWSTSPAGRRVLGSMVGLGVGIDYALFLVTRHREHLADGHDRRGVGRPGRGDRRPGRWSSPAAPSSSRSSAWPSPASRS